MKRTFTYALALTLTLGSMATAFAQDQFPDVPANHWAYEALETLKRDGVLVGYPDGKYRGTRLMTRYEAAVAIHAAYKKLMSLHEGLAEQVKTLEGMVGGGGGDMKGVLDQMKADIASMKTWGDDVATLKKMVEEFEKELTGLGADVDKMKAQLGDLDSRVTALEKKMNVSVTGDVNLLVFAGNSRDKYLGMNKEGRIVGYNEKSGVPAAGGVHAGRAGLQKDLNIYHELALNLKGSNTEGPKWWATILFGNTMSNTVGGGPGAGGAVLGDFVNLPFGNNYSDNNAMDIAITDLGVSFDTSLAGVGFNAVVGRIGKKVSPYILQRADNTYYFKNDRWDDGNWRLDGGQLTFKFGGVDLMLFGGKPSTLNTNNNNLLNPANLVPAGTPMGAGGAVAYPAPGYAGTAMVDTLLGAQVGFNVGTMGRLNAAYVYFDTDTAAAGQNNRLSVFGGDGAFCFGNIKVNAGYSKSLAQRNSTNAFDKKNQAAFINAGWDATNWGVSAEYRKIQSLYVAAGSWRRIGTLWNPTNISTFTGNIWFKPTGNIKLFASGEFGKTIDRITVAGGKENITSIIAGVDFDVNAAWKATLSYEDVKIDDAGSANDVKQKWVSLGLGYNLGTNAMLNLAYELGSVTNPYAWGQGGAGSYKGGFLTTQLTIKF